MSSIRNIVKVFLASPGDLGEERKAAKAVVDEFNVTWSDRLGYQVQLVGWEDTLSIWGRPQETINRDLEQCELFIGVMWKKWGTAPAKAGPFTSGFEEEFRTSVERRRESGRPEISMFFKNVPEDLLLDPGDELKKVLAFRSELIDGKEILFQQFAGLEDFQQLIRRRISTYVQALAAADEMLEEGKDSASERIPDGSIRKPRAATAGGALFAPQESAFLSELLAREETKEIMPSEAARLQLVSHALSTSSNDRDALGPHDANLIFGIRHGATLSNREQYVLLETGLSRLEYQNAPLWHWLYSIPGDPVERLVVESLAGLSDSVRVGAINALALAEYRVVDYDWQTRQSVIVSWLEDGVSSSVKAAAISYLAKCGFEEDMPALEREWSKGDHATARPAGEAMISIRLREGRIAALKMMGNIQLETMDEALVRELPSILEVASRDQLEEALSHRNAEVRLAALREISKRPNVSIDLIEQLKNDVNADVRYASLLELERRGRRFDLDEAKSIIQKPSRNALSAWSLAAGTDSRADANWDLYRTIAYGRMADADLVEAYEQDAPLEPWAYIALAQRPKFSAKFDFRADLADKFARRHESMFAVFEQRYGEIGSAIVSRTRKLADYSRKGLYRHALTLLCVQGVASDLELVRSCVDSKVPDAGLAEIGFLQKFGDWSDILRISEVVERIPGLGVFDRSNRSEASRLAAEAIVKLAGKRVDELARLPLPTAVMEKVLAQLSDAKIKQISNEAFETFFQSALDGLRRIAVLRAVHALPKSRVTALLENYEGHVGSRYYNVAFWLDLGVSAPDAKTRARISSNAVQTFH